jgi:hypothetical protein
MGAPMESVPTCATHAPVDLWDDEAPVCACGEHVRHWQVRQGLHLNDLLPGIPMVSY